VGPAKIEIARNVIGDVLRGWPQNTELGLIAYGHREKANCGDIQMLVPVGRVNASVIKAVVDDINPKGKTPLTDAVKLAAKELRSTEEKATVILVSDGLETCNADPCAIASELEKSGVNFTVHVVGFGTSKTENRQLQCLADNTGGRLLSANNASQLKNALVETVQLVEKPIEEKTIVVKVPAGQVSLKTPFRALGKILDGSGNVVKLVSWIDPELVPPGRYRINIDDVITTDIEIKSGEQTIVDLATLGGWIGLKGKGFIIGHLYDLKGDRVADIDTVNPPKFFLPGQYRLRVGDVDKSGTLIELNVSQKIIIDVER
jgi:Ca-activated chloride channel homolog